MNSKHPKMKKKDLQPSLVHRVRIKVRFSEVDAMHVAWHGSYVKYFEDAREAFGIEYAGLGYADYFRSDYVAPVVRLEIDYKQSLRCGDEAIVEIRYVDTHSAKIWFDYTIFRAADMEVMATGRTIQVFTTHAGEMQYACPQFYLDWKERWLPKFP